MSDQKQKKNWLEWAVFGMGSILTLAVIGYLGFSIWTTEDGHPHIVIQLGQPIPQGQEFAVPVDVTNRGPKTAESVRVKVVMRISANNVQSGEVQLKFLPSGATRKGMVIFSRDPADAETLSARVLGYQVP